MHPNASRFFSTALAAIAVILFVASACSAGPNKEAKAAFERGDFATCINIVAEELRKKPDHQDHIHMLESAIPLCFEKQKRLAEAAATRQDWDAAYQGWKVVSDVGGVLAGIPPVPKKVEGQKEKQLVTFSINDVGPDLTRIREQAIASHYAKAQASEASGQFKAAAVEYRHTREYDETFRDAAAKYAECREKAFIKVAVMPFEDRTGKRYGAIGDLLTQQVLSSAMGLNPEFVQFVTRDYLAQLQAEHSGVSGEFDEAAARKLGAAAGVQAFVFGKLLMVVEDYPGDKETSGANDLTHYSKQGNYVTHCNWTLHSRRGAVKVQGSFQIIDAATGVIKKSSNIENGASDFTSWVTFSGDQDAIPGNVREQHLSDRSIQPAAALVNEAINGLGGDLAKNLIGTFE